MSIYERNSDKEDREIDLEMLSQKASGMYRRMNSLLYNIIRFVIAKKWILLGLLVVGVALGFYMDRSQKSYEHQIIVSPNFGSVDYLYNKVDLLNAKIKERDSVFLKSIGLTRYMKISKITIEPIVDIYRFIQENEHRLEMVKLMSEDSDIKKIVVEPTTSKNYAMHQILIKTGNRRTAEDLQHPILEYLNDSPYYKQVQKEVVNNVENRIIETDTIISQINSLLKAFAAAEGRSGSGVYINENTQLNAMIESKERFIREQGNSRLERINIDKIIKVSSSTINVERTDIIGDNMKIILPLLFIFIYMGIYLFIGFYRSQTLREQQLKEV